MSGPHFRPNSGIAALAAQSFRPQNRSGLPENFSKNPLDDLVALSVPGQKRRSNSRQATPTLPTGRYGLAFFVGAGAAVFFLAVSPPVLLNSVKASLALNGNRRTDVSPVVLRVTSTRR